MKTWKLDCRVAVMCALVLCMWIAGSATAQENLGYFEFSKADFAEVLKVEDCQGMGCPVSADRARADRRICPPPSPWEPSIRIRDAVDFFKVFMSDSFSTHRACQAISPRPLGSP